MRAVREYSSGRVKHFGVCDSFDVWAPAGEADRSSVHGGLEVNFFPQQDSLSPAYMKLRGQIHKIHRGNFLLFNPREEHIEIYSGERPTHLQAVVFEDATLQAVLNDTGIAANELVFDRISESLDPSLAHSLQLIFSLRESGAETRLAFECLAVDLIVSLLERCPSSASARLKREWSRGGFPSNIARAQRIMAQNLGNSDFDLAVLASEAGISKFHLIRSFKKRTGISPLKYLQLVRMEVAKSMLARGSSVSDAAMASGFATFSAFNKAFKKSLGCAPREYSSRSPD